MRIFLSFFLLAVSSAFAADPEERVRQEVEKALIERDRQSAEFAAGADRPALEHFHARELYQPRPDERVRQSRDREAFVLRLPPPGKSAPGKSGSDPKQKESGSDPDFHPALPLPGGPEHGVESIAPAGVGG